MKWPDFIIFGAHKCGTTQLFLNLNKHPDITMCRQVPIEPDSKVPGVEVSFWGLHNWEKGIDWYKSLFHGDLCGEKTPGYFIRYGAMKGIATYIPNVKLILSLRNPVDRAYSHFQSFKRLNKVKEFDVNDQGYLETGRYIKHLRKNVLPFFDKSQLYIVISEWMRKDPNKELSKLHKFLGANPLELPVKKAVPYDKYNFSLYDDSQCKEYHFWANKYDVPKNIRKDLSARFEKHNNELFEFLGYEIEEWKDGGY